MKQLLRKLGLAVGLVSATVFLASCGGSGAGAGGAGSSGTNAASSALAAATPTTLTLTADSQTLDSDGKKTVMLTATTKNANNVVLKGAVVSFSSADTGATLIPADTKTDESGSLQASLKTTSKTTRVIKVTATSGSLTSTIDIAVAGTTLSINGPTGLGFAATANYTLLLKDSGGNPIPGQTVTLVTQNTVSKAPSVTDSQGQASFVLTGSRSGSDVIQASVLGTTSTLNIAVTPTQLAFEAPTPLAELPVGLSQPTNLVNLRLLKDGLPLAGKTVSLASTRGSVTTAGGAPAVNLTTDADGRVSFRVQSVDAGFSTLTASADGIVVSQSIEFVARVPSQVTLQAGPSVVGVNLTSASSNAAQLVARVTDGTNPVKGVRVDFSAIADPTGGRIEPAFAITDSYGQATSSFFGGAVPSGTDLVQVRASLPVWGAVTPSTARLTVAQQEISIRLGAANQLVIDSENTAKYIHPYTVLVTDNAGRPITGAKVTASVQPKNYLKGTYFATSAKWIANYTAFCASEDVNRNGLLEAPEDDALSATGGGNGDGVMTPGNIAAISVKSVDSITTSDGYAVLHLSYPKVYGLWTEVEITVSILAPSGTEAKQTTATLLQVLANDLTALDVDPPGKVWSPTLDSTTIPPSVTPGYVGSPFGKFPSCRVSY